MTKTLRTVWLSDAERFDASPLAIAGSMPHAFDMERSESPIMGIIRLKPLSLPYVFRPRGMTIDWVDGKPNDLDVAPVELRLELCHVAQLGGADRREILGMGEQYRPGIADPIVKMDRAFCRRSFEIGCGFADLQCHYTSPFSAMYRWLYARKGLFPRTATSDDRGVQ